MAARSRAGGVSRIKPDVIKKPTFSPTKFNSFIDCAIKYRYIYVDKIGKYYFKSSPGFSFGTTLHQVLQKFHGGGGAADANEMIAELHSGWISAGYESAAQEAQLQVRAEEIVQQYHLSHVERISEQIQTILVEKTISCDMGRFKLSGRVDRIDQYPDGALEIVDYKSGRLSVEPEEIATSLAMNCYQLILSRTYPGVPVRGTIYCLQTGVQASYELSGENLSKFASDITEIGNTILDFGWDAARPIKIDYCDECEFLARCQTYWRQMERNRDIADAFSDSGL